MHSFIIDAINSGWWPMLLLLGITAGATLCALLLQVAAACTRVLQPGPGPKCMLRWQVRWWCIPANWARTAGWREVGFGVVRYHTLPPAGAYPMHGKHYSGFLFRAFIWLPWEVQQWR